MDRCRISTMDGTRPELFNPIRSFIDKGDIVNDFVRRSATPIIPGSPGWWTHITTTFNIMGVIYVYLQFFISLNNMPTTYMVRLNRDMNSLALFERKCHLFTYNQPIKKIGKYYGEAKEIKNTQSFLIKFFSNEAGKNKLTRL